MIELTHRAFTSIRYRARDCLQTGAKSEAAKCTVFNFARPLKPADKAPAYQATTITTYKKEGSLAPFFYFGQLN